MKEKNKDINNLNDNETVEIETIQLELEDGTIEECEVLDILEIDDKNYVSLLPLDTDEYCVYACNMVGEEIEIINIEDDDEYEKVIRVFEDYYTNIDDDDEV